jgi:hypothetical protein
MTTDGSSREKGSKLEDQWDPLESRKMAQGAIMLFDSEICKQTDSDPRDHRPLLDQPSSFGVTPFSRGSILRLPRYPCMKRSLLTLLASACIFSNAFLRFFAARISLSFNFRASSSSCREGACAAATFTPVICSSCPWRNLFLFSFLALREMSFSLALFALLLTTAVGRLARSILNPACPYIVAWYSLLVSLIEVNWCSKTHFTISAVISPRPYQLRMASEVARRKPLVRHVMMANSIDFTHSAIIVGCIVFCSPAFIRSLVSCPCSSKSVLMGIPIIKPTRLLSLLISGSTFETNGCPTHFHSPPRYARGASSGFFSMISLQQRK